MEKDYSLLRPFDLEAAKRGDAIIENTPFGFKVKLMGALSNGRKVLVEFEDGSGGERYAEDIKMAPLAWVEGKPVYREDVLYATQCMHKGRAVVANGNPVYESDGYKYLPIEFPTSSTANADMYGMTWQKPKTKREGWVNIHRDTENAKHPAIAFDGKFPYKTKRDADESPMAGKRIDCVRFEWEE